jgi:DNA-binding transcriptional LysR family regulator
MMNRLEAMKILISVVDAGGFSAASRKLRIPLATVSRKVSELEKHVGARLLVRTTRRVALTDAGTTYVASARRILDDVAASERVAAGEYQSPRGELVITAPVFFGRAHVVPIVADFLAAHPAIDVRLLLSDRNLHLVDEHIDAAVRIGALPDSSMIAARVGSMRTVVCASPSLLDRYGIPQDPASVAKLPIVHFGSEHVPWRFRSANGRKALEVPLRPRLSVSTAEAAIDATVAGVGITRVLHYQCAPHIRDGTLRAVLVDFEVEPQPVHILHAGGRALASKTSAFLDYATPLLRTAMATLAAGRSTAR